jgi:predicted  nucleic acid-binding Zn-ribbon protein
MELYRTKAIQVSEKLESTLSRLNGLKDELDKNKKKDTMESANELLKIIDQIEEDGKRLENLVDPMNFEIEKLAKEEVELYKQIVDTHPTLSEDQIVNTVQDRLIKEGLSQ